MCVCTKREGRMKKKFVAFKISFIAPPLFSMWQDWMLKMSDCVSEQCCDATIRNTHTVVTTHVIFTSVINLKVFFSPTGASPECFQKSKFLISVLFIFHFRFFFSSINWPWISPFFQFLFHYSKARNSVGAVQHEVSSTKPPISEVFHTFDFLFQSVDWVLLFNLRWHLNTAGGQNAF